MSIWNSSKSFHGAIVYQKLILHFFELLPNPKNSYKCSHTFNSALSSSSVEVHLREKYQWLLRFKAAFYVTKKWNYKRTQFDRVHVVLFVISSFVPEKPQSHWITTVLMACSNCLGSQQTKYCTTTEPERPEKQSGLVLQSHNSECVNLHV